MQICTFLLITNRSIVLGPVVSGPVVSVKILKDIILANIRKNGFGIEYELSSY